MKRMIVVSFLFLLFLVGVVYPLDASAWTVWKVIGYSQTQADKDAGTFTLYWQEVNLPSHYASTALTATPATTYYAWSDWLSPADVVTVNMPDPSMDFLWGLMGLVSGGLFVYAIQSAS
jgi:hypothetical protein